MTPTNLEFKMKPQWGRDQDMLELGRGNACIVDGAAAFDDISKFDDDGKIRRTGLNLSLFQRLPSYMDVVHFRINLLKFKAGRVSSAASQLQCWSKSQ